jgi:hypothetical protein
MDDINIWDIVGWILKWAVCVALALLAIKFLLWMAQPVIEQVTVTFNTVGAGGSYFGEDRIYGLAVICIVLIAFVGAIKAFRK